jgi:hypothetical protein
MNISSENISKCMMFNPCLGMRDNKQEKPIAETQNKQSFNFQLIMKKNKNVVPNGFKLYYCIN